MKMIIGIMRTELKAIFFTPIAWVLLVMMVLQTSLAYTGMLDRNYDLMLLNGPTQTTLSHLLFSHPWGALSALSNNLILYIPLLCMGLLSRELHSGSIKLLTSSPIRLVQIVLGKYLAVLVYLLSFVGFLIMLTMATGLVISEPDYASIAVGIFGIYILACVYAAIGLFMSSLTTHQVVAALGTLSVLVVLEFVGRVGQSVPIIDDIAYWLSISGRSEYLINGLLVSKDIIYFILLISLFLALTTLHLAAGRKSRSAGVMAAKFAGVVSCVVVAGAVSSLPQLTFYHDATRIKSNTLSEGSLKAIEELQGPWSITTYVNVLDLQAQRFLPRERNAFHRRQYSEYLRENQHLSLDYVYYYAPVDAPGLYEEHPGKSDGEIAEFYAAQYGMNFESFLSEHEVRARVDLGGEVVPNFYHIQWRDRDIVLRNFPDSAYIPNESHISAAIQRLTSGPANVAYVTGHGERSTVLRGPDQHNSIVSDVTNRFALVNHGFEVAERTLDSPVGRDEFDILVLAAPQVPLSTQARDNLAAYIAEGGNLLISAEPGSEQVLNPIIEELGVELLPGQLTQSHEEYSDDLIFAALARETGSEVPLNALFPVTARFSERGQPVLMNGAASLRYRPDGPFTATPLLVAADATTLTEAGHASDQDLQTTALLLTRNFNGHHQQRIIITSDADFMSDAETRRTGIVSSNRLFSEEVFTWLSEGRFPIDISRPRRRDNEILVAMNGLVAFKAVFIAILPTALILAGASLLFYRRRR